VRYLQQWWPTAERRALAGTLDKGDVINVPLFCIEVKGDRSNAIPKWKQETLTERVNAGEPYCALVVRIDHKAVDQWDLWMPIGQLGMPELGEDSWVRMPFATGAKVISLLIARHGPSSPS
jgi:hypothetical protein